MTGPALLGTVGAVVVRDPTDPARAAGLGASARDAMLAARKAFWAKKARTFGPLLAAVALLAERTLAGVVTKIGHAGATLDDAYIHFQYARAIAEGHPLRFSAGAPITSGSTSLLWPALLAPVWALGARGESLVWAAWLFSFAALAGLAWEASRLTERLAGKTAAIGAGAMTLAFGGFLWCAASGMEVMPFAWAIARASRRASEWSEAPSPERTGRRAGELIVLAWTAALFRPEGAVTALFVAVVLAVFARGGVPRSRWLALGPAAAVAASPLALWILTGSARSTTAVAKLLPGNPYYVGEVLVTTIAEHAKILVSTLLNGEIWSAEFLPRGGAPLACAGLGAVVILGVRSHSRWRAAAVLLLALTMFAPCFYLTFLWNRLRYLWPFATGFLVGLACLARLVGDLAAMVNARWRAVTALLCGAFVGLLGSKLDWVMDDVAQSASGIDRQQVALGRWAKEGLPPDARIGVNDTGAIAYFSDRATFDIVGLTTVGEARYWVAGVGSRLEHYERLYARSPSVLPTHFIVYPEWMGLAAVLGSSLHEATVTDASILGGQTMRAYRADWSKLGSGELPWSSAGPVLDALDVADLESEAEHDYDLLGARDGEEAAHAGLSPAGTRVIDGARTERTRERFVAHLPAGAAARGIVRLDGPPGCIVRVFASGRPVGQFVLRDEDTDADWVERSFDVAAALASANTPIELQTAGGAMTVYHYWFVANH